MIAAGLVAFLASLLLTPVVRAAARSIGVIARPSNDRWHSKPTALLGGVAIVCGVLAGAVTIAWGRLPQERLVDWLGTDVTGILAAALVMFGAGVIDDVARLRPASKLVFQGLAGALLLTFGVVVPVSPWMSVNIFVTFFWFIGMTNALNLLDNMDGVAGGVAGVAAGAFAGIFAATQNWGLAALSLAVSGACFGFIPYNFRHASVFMGDSGSLTLGALLAGIGAACAMALSQQGNVGLLAPLFVLVVPLVDTMLVTATRTLAGLSIMQGGRDHTTHRLVRVGFSEQQVALLLYALTAVGGGLVLLFVSGARDFAMPAGALFAAIALIAAVHLSRLHDYEAPAAREERRLALLVTSLLSRGRAVEVVLDTVVFGSAYYVAYLLSFDGAIPAGDRLLLERTVAVAAAAKLTAFALFGLYRGAWHESASPDYLRLIQATIVGSGLTAGVIVLVFEPAGFSSLFIIDAVLVVALATTARALFHPLVTVRRALYGGVRTLIYGAGLGGELLLKEIRENPALGLEPVAFLDDDPINRGSRLHGLPVVIGGDDIDEAIGRYEVGKVLISSRDVDPDRLRALVAACEARGIELMQHDFGLSSIAAERIPTGNGDARAPGVAQPVGRTA